MGSASVVDEVLGRLKMLERRAPRGNFVEIGKMINGQGGRGGGGRWVRARIGGVDRE